MIDLRALTLTFVVASLCTLGCAGAGEADSTRGPSPDAPPELARLGYLTGEWSVQTFTRDDSGEFTPDPLTSFFRARYLRDGLSLLTEFYEENADGFYGFHVITHDSERGLVDSYFNARAGRRLEFSGRFTDETYELTRPGGYGGGSFLYREIDSEIAADTFVKRIYRSDDGGQTWVEGDYMFRFHRIE